MLKKLKQIFNSDGQESNFSWSELNTLDQLEQIVESSHASFQVLFKHSTRCSISSMAKRRLETSDLPKNIPYIYLLDLISFREVSNKIAEQLNVRHESPQLIVLKDGKAIFHASHGNINMQDLNDLVAEG